MTSAVLCEAWNENGDRKRDTSNLGMDTEYKYKTESAMHHHFFVKGRKTLEMVFKNRAFYPHPYSLIPAKRDRRTNGNVVILTDLFNGEKQDIKAHR